MGTGGKHQGAAYNHTGWTHTRAGSGGLKQENRFCVRSETRDFKASSVFMWMTGVAMLPLLLLFKPGGERNTRYFCDRVRYSLFLVFKKKKQSYHQTTNQFSPARVCVL